MIRIKDAEKIYQTGAVGVRALRGISVHIRPNEFVAVMGPSGSGKSTLMNLLGLLDRFSAGTYVLDNIEVSRLSEKELARLRNQKIGFVFQAFNLLPQLTALKNVELPLVYAGVKPGLRREKAVAALKQVGLENRLHHRPNELSGGQNQRVAIARALVNNPAIILADEPTGALDTRTGVEIMSIFQELHRRGATIVLVTHEKDIARHAGRILYFRDGLLVGDKTVEKPVDAVSELASMGKGVSDA